MERLTLDEAICRAKGVAKNQRWNSKYVKVSLMNEELNKRHESDCIKDAEEHEQLARWLEELKSYKDIGTPKELKELKENGAFTGLELVKLAIMQKELKEYRDLEEQGLLVRLPDDLNRILYQVNYRWTECTEYGEENNKCECDIKKEYYIAEVDLQYIPIKSYYNCLGEFLFLTREEAEKKLEELKNEI